MSCKRSFRMTAGWWMWMAAMAGLLPFTIIKASSSNHIEDCRRGPFTFERGAAWNTSGSLWSVERAFQVYPLRYNHFMALSFSESRASVVGSQVESPPLCARYNGTYHLSFRFSVPGWFSDTSCYLAVHLLTDTLTPLWRSSGGTLDLFFTLSPPLKFRSCSSDFKLVFEGTKVTSGKCGRFGNSVTFDDVSFTYVEDPVRRTEPCSDGPEPYPDHQSGKLNTPVIIAVTACLAVVVIVIAVLILAAFLTMRKRRTQRASHKTGYRTFASEAVDYVRRRESTSNYEPMDNDDKLRHAHLMPSGGSDAYNRLHVTGATGAMEEPWHSHYDHFDGDTAYNNLRHHDRWRELQRQNRSTDYHHI